MYTLFCNSSFSPTKVGSRPTGNSTGHANASFAKYDSSRLAGNAFCVWAICTRILEPPRRIVDRGTFDISRSKGCHSKIASAEMLKQVLTCHLGVTKTLERAKDNIFWPGMTKQNPGLSVALRGVSHSQRLKCKRTFNATRSPSRSVPKTRIWYFLIWGKELSFDFMLLQSFFRDRLLTRHACKNGNTKVKGTYGAEWHMSSVHIGQRSFLFLPNIKSEMRSFKSNENIHKKKGGSYYVVSANKASSVTL